MIRKLFKRKRSTLSRRDMPAGAALVMCLGLLGCGNVNNGVRQVSALRVIDTSPNAGSLDLYANTTALTYSVGFGTLSSYILFTPGTYTLSARQAGTATVLGSTHASLVQGVQYTLLVGNAAAGLQTLLLEDQGAPAPPGQIALRFIDQAMRAGPVDLYLIPQGGTLATTVAVATGVTFNNAASGPQYINVPAGSYTLAVVPNGTVPTATTVTRYTGAVVSYPAGSARTLVLLDGQLVTAPNVQVITASDYDSALATS